MPKSWTHTAAFKHFGTAPRNVHWSWSARSLDGETVVVTLWQDQFKRRDGRLIYESQFDPGGPRDTRPGFHELMDNLVWARDHCDGRFRVIVAKAKDINSYPRSIAECFPHDKMIMRLSGLDLETGNFAAEVDGA
jgi:hypothetical protein